MDAESETTIGKSKCVSVSSRINFKIFTNLLEQINKIDESNAANRAVPKNEEKKRTLQKFYELWRSTARKLEEEEKANSTQNQVDENYFHIMRLLLPADDRRVFGLKETKLAKYLIDALCIAPKSDDAMKLINYRAPNSVKAEGDFASVAYFILKNRCQESNTLSIEEINSYLDTIAFNNAKGKTGLKEVNRSIKHLLVSLSALQLKWLIRIILKDLKVGIRESIIFESFHPDAMDLYNFTSSLEKVCNTLVDPMKRLHEVGVSVFTPCRPMLGEKAKPSKVENLLGGRQFYIETKFDGERFQLHKKGSKYMYFSRNSHDYTEMFGDDIHSGTLTPFIHSLFKANVTSLILDGEMCTYSATDRMILSLPEEHTVRSKSRMTDIQTCFCVFDILMLNDEVLTNKPLKQRCEFMKKTFDEQEGRLMMSQRELAANNQAVVEALNKAIDSRLEGIVVKDPESVYKPSVRSGSGWYKVKPDYMLGLNDDLDLLIVGGYYGTGKRAGILSHFLLAVALDIDQPKGVKKPATKPTDDDDLDFFGDEATEKEADLTPQPKEFYTFCKIGSGYTYKELKDFNDKLADKWHKYDKNYPPKSISMMKEHPDVWIEPKDSLIVQVKAVEITQTDKYKTGLTLRFPRLEKFRSDKAWSDCMKFSELKELYNKNEGKLASGKHFDLDDYDEKGNLNDPDGEPITKRKRTTTRSGTKATVSSRFKGVDASQIDKITNLFNEKQFCVIVGSDQYTKSFVEKKILEFNGDIVQNPGPDTYCIITAKLLHKINSYIKKDLYDVVKLDWIIKCIEEQRFIQWKPSDMLHSRVTTKDTFDKIFDAYGDSFEEDVTVETLKELFASMVAPPEIDSNEIKENKSKLRNTIALFENKYFPNESFQFGLFRLDVFYLDLNEQLCDKEDSKRIINSSLDLVEMKIKWHGGVTENIIDETVTHCVVDKSDLTRLGQLKKLNRKREIKFHIVSSQWVIECIKADRKLNELPFHL